MATVIVTDAVADDALKVMLASGVTVSSVRRVDAKYFEFEVSGPSVPDRGIVSCSVAVDFETDHRSLVWAPV